MNMQTFASMGYSHYMQWFSQGGSQNYEQTPWAPFGQWMSQSTTALADACLLSHPFVLPRACRHNK
jgi:hypothetical protein